MYVVHGQLHIHVHVYPNHFTINPIVLIKLAYMQV